MILALMSTNSFAPIDQGLGAVAAAGRKAAEVDEHLLR